MNIKKNILVVIPSMQGGGAERVVATLLNNIDNNKFNVKLVLFNATGEHLSQIPKHVQIIDFNKKNRGDFFDLVYQLRRIIKTFNPDVVLSFLEFTNIINVLSGMFLRNKPRIIISERNNTLLDLRYTRLRIIKLFLMFLTYMQANKIIAVSNGVKEMLVNKLHINKDKITTIYNPIEIQKIKEMSIENVSHPFFNNNNFVIISTGRLTAQKNYDLLIEAFHLFNKRNKDSYLIIAGRGGLEEPLKEKARTLGLEGYIDFIGFQENSFAYIRKSNVFVLTSDWEGFPNVIVEAMACGTPVISTNCPFGPNEIIKDGKNGLLIPVNDVLSLAEAISDLYNSKNKREEIRQKALEDIKQFDVNNIIPQYENILK